MIGACSHDMMQHGVERIARILDCHYFVIKCRGIISEIAIVARSRVYLERRCLKER